jgi:hypothetical protein
VDDDLQKRFYEVQDLWFACKAERDVLQAEITKSFSEVASGSMSNPSLDKLDSLEKLTNLQEEFSRILRFILDEFKRR